MLLGTMTGGVGQPPKPDSVVVAELGPDDVDVQGRPIVVAEKLRAPKAYEERFEQLLAKGFSWINLSYYGVLDGNGLVVVELPRETSTLSPRPTSVNFSGPPAIVANSGWDARSIIALHVYPANGADR